MNYGGTSITYDEIGNPETIGDKTLTWKGRELISYTDEAITVSTAFECDIISLAKCGLDFELLELNDQIERKI